MCASTPQAGMCTSAAAAAGKGAGAQGWQCAWEFECGLHGGPCAGGRMGSPVQTVLQVGAVAFLKQTQGQLSGKH